MKISYINKTTNFIFLLVFSFFVAETYSAETNGGKEDKIVQNLQQFYHHPNWLPLEGDIQLIRLFTNINHLYQEKYSLNDQILYKLYFEDQSDRTSKWWAIDLRARDRTRLEIVESKIRNGHVRTSLDYLNAAIIMHHGGKEIYFRKAVSLSKKSVELNPNNKLALWLNCVANNRLLNAVAKERRRYECD